MAQLVEDPSWTYNDEVIRRFTWRAGSVTVTVISYGAIIQSIKVPDNRGETTDIVLGFDDIESYVKRNRPHFGAAIGRCANRIGGASFKIDGVTYKLAKNIGENHLHGGTIAFDKVNWKTTVDGNKVIFSYLSKDGEEGYPGDVLTNITYELKDNEFHVDFMSTTTRKTVINLTNHSYFNLAGHDAGAQELLNHEVAVFADKITETDSSSIPTGRLIPVGGTLYDLRNPRRLGDAIAQQQTLYDDNYCITNFGEKQNVHYIARVLHPQSGRTLEVYSDQPGVQLYTSYFLPAPTESAIIGKGGVGYRRHGAFCLETQNYPDAVHHDNFPSPILKPGDVYKHKVVYSFGVNKLCDPVVVSA